MLPSLMPSIADMLVDRYLRIDLDGGQFAAQSPLLPASRRFQYRFSCQVMTRGLEHDTALAQFEFLNDAGEVIETHSTAPMSGTQDWTTLTIPAVQPPFGATKMQVRLRVLHSDDGLEDIRGSIGFDNIRIDQHPQLAVATDRPLGVYQNGQAVIASARIMGLPKGESNIQFVLYGSAGEQIATANRRVEIEPADTNQSDRDASATESLGTRRVMGIASVGTRVLSDFRFRRRKPHLHLGLGDNRCDRRSIGIWTTARLLWLDFAKWSRGGTPTRACRLVG